MLRYTIPSLLLLGSELLDAGTDYLDITAAGSFLALTGAGSGSLVLAERASGALLDVVDLAPFQPLATPQEAAFVRATGANEPHKLYVVNYFRESLRAIDLTAGAPYALGAEVALAHSGQIRLPFVDLSPEEDGDWFLRSVQFFKGTPSSPNPVTCFTCHTDNGSDGLQHLKNPPVLWRAGDTGPWGSKGNKPVLSAVVSSTFGAHGIFAGPPTPVSISTIVAFLENDAPAPPSPFVGLDGSLGADALAGKALFEGSAGCVQCHAAPLYIPPPGNPLTIAGGVGTGLLNANVPTLLGVWASAPYLHSGDATTLEDVLTMNAGDLHGTTSQLTAAERAQLVAFLRTL